MKGVRHITRALDATVLLGALVASLVPRGELYRCVAMDGVADAPCCAGERGATPPAQTTIAASCCEHLPAVDATFTAVFESAHPRLDAAPLHALAAWPPAPAILVHERVASTLARVRGSPPERRLRVPTVVLRV